jgi:hypothetical protein
MGPTYPWHIFFTVRHGFDDICGAPICGAPQILIRGAPKLSAPQIMGPWIRVFLVVIFMHTNMIKELLDVTFPNNRTTTY